MSNLEETLVLKVLYTAFAVPLLLSGVIIWFLIFYQKKKYAAQLREKDLIISRQKALEMERTRIAGDMHDELGGGLTSIKFLSQGVLQGVSGEKERNDLQKIVHHSEKLVANMSEIIWAMNAGFDTLESLIAFVRRYAYDFLEEQKFTLNFEVIGAPAGYQLSGEKRRNIFLVIKEAIHNLVKHSGGDHCEIAFNINNKLEIRISDNGKGMELAENELGNGLRNMKTRAKALNGKLNIESDSGVSIHLELPLESPDS